MLSRYNQSISNDVPVSALWIQDWAGELVTSFGSRLFWNWQWDSQRYPGTFYTLKYTLLAVDIDMVYLFH